MVHKEFMNKRQLKSYEKMEDEVERLNNEFEVGEIVRVKNDFGSFETDRITNPFSIMSGNVVAWLDKKRCYLSERVFKVD